MKNHILTLAAGALAAVLLAGCAAGQPETPAESTTHEDGADGHGGHEGHDQGAEVAEAPLHLVTISAEGRVGLLDLASGDTGILGQAGDVRQTATDGRYVFASTGQGLQVVDSGMWSWAHGDHHHYYRSTPKLLGVLNAGTLANITGSAVSTAGGTGAYFSDTGRAALLDNAELSRGRLETIFNIQTSPHNGLVAPLGQGALVSQVGADHGAVAVQYHGQDGQAVEGSRHECRQAQGAIATDAGLVIGCRDGALIATMSEGGEVGYRLAPYPDGTAEQEKATAFAARKSRTTVAAVAGDHGAWLLDAREGTWQRILEDAALVAVSAVDDRQGHVVALDTTGRVHVTTTSDPQVTATTEVLVENPDLRNHPGLQLAVDRQRAYLNDPAGGTVYEIAFADHARVTRELSTPTTPDFMAETGR